MKQAVKIGITWEALLDLIDVLVANYNITENRGLGGQSPLQVLINQLSLAEPLFLPRILPPPTVDQPELGVVVETRFVRGSQKNGRRPYVEIDRVKYTSPVLARSFALIGKMIRLHIREMDMRVVDAFFESGQELGSLRAQGRWGKTAHTREMRKQINALIDAGEMCVGPDDDPVEKLLLYYSSKAYRDATARPNSISRAATKLANAANVSRLPVPAPAVAPASPNSASRDGDRKRAHPIPSTVKAPIWKSVT